MEFTRQARLDLRSERLFDLMTFFNVQPQIEIISVRQSSTTYLPQLGELPSHNDLFCHMWHQFSFARGLLLNLLYIASLLKYPRYNTGF